MIRLLQTKFAGTDNELTDGQTVIIAARWLLIVVALLITLWNPAQSDLDKVRVTVFVLLALAAANFFLQAQILMHRRVDPVVTLAASAADIGVITVITAAYGGLNSSTFVFYFPALIALALAFPRIYTVVFTTSALALYAAVSAPDLHTDTDAQRLVQRLIALASVAVVANLFLYLERQSHPATPRVSIGHGHKAASNAAQTPRRRRSHATPTTPVR